MKQRAKRSLSTGRVTDDGLVGRLALSVAETGRALGTHRNTVYALLRAGLLRYVRLAGGQILVPVAAIDEYLSGKAR